MEKAWWHDREQNEYAWKVPIQEVKGRNYNLDISNPNTSDSQHGDPVKLLAAYQSRLADIAEEREMLRQELKSAIESVINGY